MPKSISIVVVEDNLSLQGLMVDHLQREGYHVQGVSCAEDLDDLLVGHRVDILVLDLNLPSESGIDIAKRLREAQPSLYIVILTARTGEKDKALGYESGADIYLTKPASPIEVTAAISSIERRIAQHRQTALSLSLDVQKMQLIGQHASVHLGTFELSILKGLIAAPNQRLDYWRLMELIEKEPSDKNKVALGVQVHRLKKKMVQAGAEKNAIKSVHKEGYQLGALVQLV
jgi:DNA-binding response OmpR family regulator